MHTDDTPLDGGPPREDCTTTASFADHAVPDGTDLVTETYYRLRVAEAAFAPTEAFFDRLESAFVWAYLAATEETGVPDHVAWAIDDARAETAAAFADRPDADLRTEVLPAFYRAVAGYHCAYRAE